MFTRIKIVWTNSFVRFFYRRELRVFYVPHNCCYSWTNLASFLDYLNGFVRHMTVDCQTPKTSLFRVSTIKSLSSRKARFRRKSAILSYTKSNVSGSISLDSIVTELNCFNNLLKLCFRIQPFWSPKTSLPVRFEHTSSVYT